MNLIVIGAGGHAKVVADTAYLAGWKIVGFSDDNPNTKLFDLPHLGPPVKLNVSAQAKAVIAIGSNQIREKIALLLADRFQWATIIHPNAFVSNSAYIGEGTVVFAGAVVQPDVRIGRHVIVNTSASIDHDCQISDFCQIAPNAAVCGAVSLGTGAFIGAGATVVQNKIIGEWSILGAGGVAIHDISDRSVAIGIPAKNR